MLSMMGIVAASSVSAALSQLEFEMGCLVLVGMVAVSIFFVPKMAWRYCIYCGIAGVAIGILLMLLWMLVTEGRISSQSRSESGPLIAIVFNWRPWIWFCGSLIGGTIGFLLYQRRNKHHLKSTLTITSCRMIAIPTIARWQDNNAMHAKPDLRVVVKMDDRWFGLGDRGRYTP